MCVVCVVCVFDVVCSVGVVCGVYVVCVLSVLCALCDVYYALCVMCVHAKSCLCMSVRSPSSI